MLADAGAESLCLVVHVPGRALLDDYEFDVATHRLSDICATKGVAPFDRLYVVYEDFATQVA